MKKVYLLLLAIISFAAVSHAQNTITLTSAAGTDAQTVCINTPIINITYATTGATGATFAGLPAGVTGNWAANVVTINGTPTISGTSNYTVTLTGGDNTGSATGSIAVTPVPNAVATPASQTICSGSAIITIVNSGAVAGTTYAWTRNNTATVTGIAASGSGNISGSLTNTTFAPVTVTFTITPSANGCSGPSTTATVLVNPIPNAIAAPASQTICSGTAITTIALTSSTGGTTYTWARDNTGSVTGIAASGTGNISGTLTNTTFAPMTVTFTITPTANGCTGPTTTATVLVSPTPDVNQPANQVVCNNTATAAVNFSGSVAGTSFSWTNNTPSIGLAASGVGNIASFTATNPGTAPVVATVTVTPSTGTLSGSATFNYTGAIQNFTVPAGVTLISVTARGAQGSNNTGSAFRPGLGASISGDIAVTPGQVLRVLVGQQVTTTAGNGGGGGTFLTDISNNPLIIAGGGAGSGDGDNANKGGQSGTAGGNGPASGGTGGIAGNGGNAGAAFFQSGGGGGLLTNGAAGSFASYLGFAFVNGGAGGSGGAPGGFGGGCSGSGVIVGGAGGGYSGGGSGSNVSGIAGMGGGGGSFNAGSNQVNLAANNTGNGILTITYSGTTFCTGTPRTFSITVNPTPNATATPAAQTICSATAITTIVNSGTVAGTVYNWVRNNTALVTGIAASGTGNIAGVLNNTTTAPVTVTFTVTPTYTNASVTCTGAATTATVVVNPTPTVNAVASQVRCNGAASNAVLFSGNVAGTVYNWTNSDPSIGLAASGTGNIAPFTVTNATTDPVTATITVIPSFTNAGTTCTGAPTSFTITVNPTATVDVVPNQILCSNVLTNAINFSSSSAGFPASTIVYTWVNTAGAIGLAGSGTGNIPAFTATNNGTAPLVANITVTPTYTYNGVSCTGTASTFSITVNPRATANALANQSLCNGNATAAVNFSSIYTGGSIVYNWVNNDPSIGLAAGGAGNIASFTAINITTAPVTATIVVTPTYTSNGVSCVGTASMFTITVNPTASVDAVADETLCANQVTAPIVFTSPVNGTIYNWVNNNPSIGLAASGTGNIPSFTTNNNLTNATAATITVRPTTANGCIGTAINFTITVNPIATVNVVANQVLCNGASTAAINFSSTATGGTIVYDWINNDPSIGIAASGTGNIPTFVASNITTAPVIATIAVTPTFTNGGVSCVGISRTFTITVNPTATVDFVSDQTRCNGDATTVINFTSPNSGNGGSNIVFNWVNNITSIGLAASGTGDIASFVTSNTGLTPAVATITVTPTYTNGGVSCIGTPLSFTITVLPRATVNTIPDQTLCNNASTAAINFSSPNSGGIITFNWFNDNTGIGLASNGGGNIASFTATNATSSPITANITVTPVFMNTSETLSCNGVSSTFTITVNPTATADPVADQTLCGNTITTPIVFSSPVAGTTYTWVNNNPSIGLAASGSGNIPSFTTANNLTNATTATITVTPTTTNGCTGVPISFTITVNPIAIVNTVANQVLCNGSSTNAINFSSPATGGTVTYSWTNSDPSIGIAASGTGNIPTFVATNAGLTPVTATINVTPTFTNNGLSCVGTSTTFTITVNPTATINTLLDYEICNGDTYPGQTVSSPNSGGAGSNIVYNWTNNTPSIGLAASGTGNIPSFIATNTTLLPLTATITVTPTFINGGVSCLGIPEVFTIIVAPIATVNPVANQSLCNNNNTTAINFSSPSSSGPNTVDFFWTNNNISIGLAANGNDNIPSFTAINNGTTVVTATINVTPIYILDNVSCAGVPFDFTITVHPTAVVNAVANQTLCANQSTATIIFSGPVAGTIYNWVNNTPSIGLAVSGTGNIPSFTTTNATTSPITATITVTPTTPNGCTGTPRTFTITVNPTATVNAIANKVVCNGASVAATTVSGPVSGAVYTWTNNTASIGLAASGTGNIPAFTATNAGTTPVMATIKVFSSFTNGGVTCAGDSATFTITVNPTATVNAVPNQTLCNGVSTAAINFTSPTSGGAGSNIVFNWVNNTPSIGLAASGAGNIPLFTATNTGTAPVTATITVAPTFVNAGVSCVGTPISFTITVNPTATVNATPNQSLCNNTSTTAINFSTTNTGGTVVYNWVNNTPSIGLAASGSGNIASFIATNTTSSAVTATITVNPIFTNAGVSCAGTASTFTITVYPTATVNAVANQTLCGNTTTASIVFSSAVSGVTYTWVNNNIAIGLAANGTGNIPSFVTVNNLTNATTATITVTPSTGNGCTGTPITFTITVNPIATVNAVANQVLCNGSSTAAIVFGSSATGGTIVYNWTNNAPSIGIAASGAGNIPTFIATNNTTTPVVASITVTPTFTNNGVSCVGTSLTFTITVNPTATVNAVANQTLCANQSTTAITFTSPNSGNGGSNVVFNWVNNTPSIGLAASGSGNIASFIATNVTTAPITATITVTPTYTNAGVSCAGIAITFTITVNPSATVNPVSNQSLCNNSATTAVNFSSNYTGGTIVYNWTNSAPSIGLAASGAGNIASFIAINATSASVTATITVTPTFTNAGVSCAGTSSTFTITVYPTATVNAVANQTLCGNTTTASIVFSSAVSGVTYTWVNNNTAIGLAASGTGNIPSFVTVNNLTNATTATITVTPSTGNGCTGIPITFTITVNPIATVNAVANQVLCNGSSTAAIVFSSPATGGTIAYNWTNNAPSIGIAASGTGNIPTFIANNNTTTPIIATITVTPTFTNNGVSCLGTPLTFTITVNPTATVNAVANQVLCNGSSTTAIIFTSPNSGNGGSNVVFNWANNNTSIGLAASGAGNIPSFTATNNSNVPVVATITVTPTYINAGVSCVGTAITFTITVNPTATVNAIANQSLCANNATAAVNFSSTYTGGSIVYNWVNNTPSIGLVASGAGNIASFIATNATSAPVTATITVTPTFTNAGVSCVGTSSTFTITVNPTATVNPVANQTLCANTATAPIVFSSSVSGTTYTWVNNNPSIGLAASGAGNIPSFVTSNTLTNATTATITVTPSIVSGCTGAPITFTITVNPIATVNAVANQVLCNGSSTAAIVFSSATTGGTIVYNWTNNAPSIGIAASGAGNIPTFVATNITTTPVVATITVTPTFTNNGVSCVGTSLTFTITVNPTATVNAVANQVLCNASSTAAIAFVSPNSGNGGSNVVFNWVNNTPSIGLAANGVGNIGSFVATNATTAPITATIIVTPTYTNAGVSCVGTAITFTITVNPTATVNAVANQSLCNNTPTAAVNFSSIYTGGSIVYNWVNNTPSIGLAATGAGNIASFVATNASNTPVTATITITPTFTNAGVSCVGTSSTFTITVNPTGNVNAISNQIHCANATTLPIVFSSGVAGTTYSWVNNNPAIGLGASGTGNIPSFVTANNLTNAITATITVTPTSPNGCTGLPITFTITVNPVATVNAVANQVLCNGSSTAAIAFSSSATGGSVIFTWTNNAPSIGLAAAGAGNIPTFIATNVTTAPVIATITVTPTFINGGVSCVGTASTFTITVNPTATVNAVANQVLCNASSSTAIIFTSPNSGNGGSNVVFNWVNNTPSIGLAANGAGNIASFIATNTTTAPVVATITVTPTYTNGGVSCVGTAMTFNITVNPTATVNAVANQSLCNNVATAAVNFSSTYTGGGIVYNWVNNTPSIGLAAAGAGNIASFIATNATNAPVTATITVTPTFTNGGVGCVGTSSTFTITVNPTAVVNAVANQSLCANTTTAPIVFSSPVSGTTYTWVNNNTAIGLVASGVGNIPSFVTTNNLNSINATITVTPNSPFGCTGLPITFVITVNPIATVNVVANQILCNGRLTDSIKFTSPNGNNGGGNIIYNWVNTAPSIGLAATGSGNILPLTATNVGAVPVIAIITVTPSFVNGTSNCVGIPITFSITVNPTAVVNAIANQTVCAGQPTTPVSFTGAVAGATYNWVNGNPAIGLAASGTGNIASFIAQNPTLSTITGTITVTPNTSFGCIGSSKSFDIIVPALSVAPTGISTPALVLCDTNTVTSLRVLGGGLGTGANWVWYRDACGGTPIGTGAVLNNITVGNTTTFYVRAEGTCNTTACASIRIQVAKLVTHVRQHWNDVLFFDNSSNNFVKWQWYKNGAAVLGATQQHYSENGGLNGTYYVAATDKNGIELLTCPLDIAAGGFSGIQLKISPNPVGQGQSYRLISSLTPAELQGATITVRDIVGTQVTQSNTSTPITTLQAPMASGMYIVTLLLRNGQRYSVTMIVR